MSFDYAPVRPPTEAYGDRDAAARWRDEVIPATSWMGPAMRVINLEGIRLEFGVISALVQPIVHGMASGAFGKNFSFGVVTSDKPVADWINDLAAANHAPVFLSGTGADTLRAVRPSGTLTPTEEATLDAVIAMGGGTTAARLAAEQHLEPAAASNRLTTLERKGFLIRYTRNRREGDLFVDPGSRARWAGASEPAATAIIGLELPVEVEASIRALAAEQGRSPRELLADAWRAYFESHMTELNTAVAEAHRQLQVSGSGSGEVDEPDVAAWADAAAARMRDE